MKPIAPPILPKRAPWTDDDARHLEKVLATMPVWNSEQSAVMRRLFQSAADKMAAEVEAAA
ncbi:hypothetical protein ABH922_003049 [Rhodococcus sp. 27YEA15]|uniref:hypothetical protein n=1 Tax=Rhodococcus sp. 27YEA15 TaxID=3156259 RepID=UPI003C7BCC67